MKKNKLVNSTDCIVDTHAHYDDHKFDEDRYELLDSMEENNIGLIVNIGVDKKTCMDSIKLSRDYDFIYTALGVHPSDCKNASLDDFSWIKENIKTDKVVAVGEIGLDYYWDKDEDIKALQKRWFLMQLDLAKNADLPVVIHSRDAAKDTLDIMMDYDNPNKGIIHCYSYSVEDSIKYVKAGYMIGIGGVVTFKDSKKLKEVVRVTPLENLVLETDCPYLTPVPNRGKRNSSLNLKYVAEAIAEIKDITAEEVIRATNRNARKIYKLI